jgi:hypothetical protein
MQIVGFIIVFSREEKKNKLKTTFNMNKAQNILNMVKYKKCFMLSIKSRANESRLLAKVPKASQHRSIDKEASSSHKFLSQIACELEVLPFLGRMISFLSTLVRKSGAAGRFTRSARGKATFINVRYKMKKISFETKKLFQGKQFRVFFFIKKNHFWCLIPSESL